MTQNEPGYELLIDLSRLRAAVDYAGREGIGVSEAVEQLVEKGLQYDDLCH